MNWNLYFSFLFSLLTIYFLIIKWYLIKLKLKRAKRKFYQIISVQKYKYNYEGISTIRVFPFTSYVLGWNSFHKSKHPIVNTFEEAEKGFYTELQKYHNEELPWQIANKMWEEKKK